jgi:hypothetical protein
MNIARRVAKALVATTVAVGLVALTPAPSQALRDTDWPCAACKSAPAQN